jgi:hypothetical protein
MTTQPAADAIADLDRAPRSALLSVQLSNEPVPRRSGRPAHCHLLAAQGLLICSRMARWTHAINNKGDSLLKMRSAFRIPPASGRFYVHLARWVTPKLWF